jgi:hypothetical protein
MTTHTCLVDEINGVRLTSHEDVLEGLFRRFSRRVGQFQCGITGHNVMLHYEPARLSLQCTSCGYESPGWELAPRRPSPSPHASARRLSPPIAA